MIRITALNDDTSKSSEEDIIHPKEPSQEVQEENALKSYNEALQEQKNGNTDKAEAIYKQLLGSNLLRKVKPEKESQKVKKADNICSLYAKPSLMLKYSCLKNMAVICHSKNDLDTALNYYTQALDIEGTDVSVWYKAGFIALKLLYLNAACEFFLKGLECSPKHWLCLDKVIICLFVLGDFNNCLYYIARAFNLDSSYTRGHVLRDKIFSEQTSLANDIIIYFPSINLYTGKKIEDSQDRKNVLLQEVITIRTEYYERLQSQVKSKRIDNHLYEPSKNLDARTWAALGEFILIIHSDVTESKKNVSFFSLINLNVTVEKELIDSESNPKSDEKGQEANVPDPARDKQGEQSPAKEPNEECEKKSRRNRGSALMEELLWGGKRRSARVRSSLRGNPEPMDVAEALRRILPRKLLHKTKQIKAEHPLDGRILEENSMDTMDLYRLFERQESAEERRQKEEQEGNEIQHDIDQLVESEGYFGTKEEAADVVTFIESNTGKNIIDIVKAFVFALETHWKKTWPTTLPNTYTKCYQIMRLYHQINFKMSCSESDFQELAREAGIVLLYGELCLEHNSSKSSQNVQKSEANLEGPFMQNVMELVERGYLFENDEKYFEFLVRLYWLRYHLFLMKGHTNLALATLNELLTCYDLHPDYASTVIKLKNNRKNNVISKPLVEEFLVYQSRKKSLAEVVRLYEDASYQELTEILKETFNSNPDIAGTQFKDQENELVSRQTQLSMLINGLYHLNEYKECLYWLEICCYELLQKAPISSFYTRVEPEEDESWMIVLDRFLVAMEDCLNLGKLTIDEALPQARVSRFVQTLCHAICKELEDSDRPPCPARPWMMLNRILIGMESSDKQETSSLAGDEDEENDIPSSVLILFTAHEYLGRREWCNCNESVLLYLIMDQVIPHIRDPEWALFRETIQQHLEQVVFCLYSHPNKKAKARYLTEHNVSSIPLTWKRGIQLFDLFRPDETPSYDSLRINLIGSETEVLFRRIAALIPDENDPVQNSEKMMDFIVGKRNDVPEATVKLPEIVKDLFYILGDYYFKTHESAKAVNYLLIDLCANPDRVDSWASMALSRASILEQQLNSCDPVKDEVFLQDALSALRCYEHCLQLDSNQCALWIEYGTFVYTIHSFCSQRMKLESHSLGMEKFEELETTKNRMLDTAKQAFTNANLIWYSVKEESERQDERWLHHYMLGKISEKHGDLGYFEHYEKAAELLYENAAEYPSKIGYTTPQTLAIEALEVYYRIHVCVIKNLELNEGKPLDSKTKQLFNKYLELGGKGHFVKQMSKSESAKMKAKEAESAMQQAKQMKIVKDLVNEMISKIEEEEKKIEDDDLIILDDNDDDEVVPVKKIKVEEDVEIVGMIRRPSLDGAESVAKRPRCDEVPPNAVGVIMYHRSEKKNDLVNGNGSRTVGNKQKVKNQQSKESLESDSRYYITLDDLKSEPQGGPPPAKKKRRGSHISVSSSSDSEEVKYDDDSSSSSSSSESSDSSPSSSSSSKDSSQSGEQNKEQEKISEDERKAKVSESTPESGSTPETVDNEDKSSPIPEKSEDDMLSRCILALETCAIRFPQHYKSVYRLAHFYFRSKQHRDLSKCRDLLLGRYHTPNGIITGLFADRKNTNFFNGIWRIPAGDVDRPGSFASHMSRSVLLLMEVLRDLKDHKMLLELCLQLRKVPEPDKKYLREDERNQLSIQAINLSVSTLRKNVRESTVMTLPIVLDSYRCYQKVQKHYPSRESVFGDILLDGFKRLGKGDKCTLEQALRFCQSEICTPKNKTPRNVNPNPVAVPKPKPPKQKREEKKKATPKPQITAKAIPKPAKPKKPERKKPVINMMQNNLLADPECFSAVMKNSMTMNAVEIMEKFNASHSFVEMMKVKPRVEKKTTESTKSNLGLDKMNIDFRQQLIMEQMKLMSGAGVFPYQNFPMTDLSGCDFFKGYNPLYANPLMGGFMPPFHNYKRPKMKYTKPRPVLKQKPPPKPETKNEPEQRKTKTNFNIEDILGKPSTSSKPQSPNVLTPSQINLSIEDKIKNAFNELECASEQLEAINLSSRKITQEMLKRSLPEVQVEITSAKRVCRPQPPPPPEKKDEIEVVVIDD